MDSACLQPVNLGNPIEITVAELANRIIARLNPHLMVSHRPLPVDDPRQRRPDISRAQHELGWMPKVSLEEGLARMVAALQAQEAIPLSEPEMAIVT
jgi:UDP-glucuronate decarboxylase